MSPPVFTYVHMLIYSNGSPYLPFSAPDTYPVYNCRPQTGTWSYHPDKPAQHTKHHRPHSPYRSACQSSEHPVCPAHLRHSPGSRAPGEHNALEPSGRTLLTPWGRPRLLHRSHWTPPGNSTLQALEHHTEVVYYLGAEVAVAQISQWFWNFVSETLKHARADVCGTIGRVKTMSMEKGKNKDARQKWIECVLFLLSLEGYFDIYQINTHQNNPRVGAKTKTRQSSRIDSVSQWVGLISADDITTDSRPLYDSDRNTWKVISHSLDIDCIHGDIHVRLCKKTLFETDKIRYSYIAKCH